MNPVTETPVITAPSVSSLQGVQGWATALCLMLSQLLSQWGYRLNRVLAKDGTEAMTGPLPLKSYTVATRPTAASYTGAIIYVSDAAAGNKLQYSDGASWVAAG